MTGQQQFSLAPSLDWRIRRVGRQQMPVIVIDNVMQHPDELAGYAATQVSFDMLDDGSGGYPGIRAPAPLNYVEMLVRAVDPLIRETYELGNAALANAECSFCLVTTPRGALHPLQTVPHIDTTYPLQFAILHYLCGQEYGGTAFYRQNATGLETITEKNSQLFDSATQSALARPGRARDYVSAGDTDYTQTAAIAAAYDRLLIYPSQLLHSGIINADIAFSADPRVGRLTSNIFVTYRA
jgi:hypothetical protein